VRFYGCGTHIRKTASQHGFAIMLLLMIAFMLLRR